MVMLAGMARTVTVHDPATDSTFQATRKQWDRLYAATMTLIADEDGQPVSQKAKPQSKPEPAAEQE